MSEEQDDGSYGRSSLFPSEEVMNDAYLAVRFAIAVVIVWFASGVAK